MREKILITGGLGLIGKSLINIFLNKYKILIIDKKQQIFRHKNYIKSLKKKDIEFVSCDISNKKNLIKLFRKTDYVIHLAALLGVKNTEKNKQLCWKINAEGTQNVVDACKINNVKKLVFSSSSEVYGEQILKKKISENNNLLGVNIYSLSKISAENYIKTNLYKSKTKFTILRLFNTYGVGQVAQFFISKLCYSAIYNKTFVINGDGNQIRSYGFSDDIASGIKSCILNKTSNGKTYNIGNSQEIYSLKEVVYLVSKILNKKLKVKFNRSFIKGDRKKNREIFYRVCDSKLIKKDLNFIPRMDLKMGLIKILKQKKIFLNWP